MADTTSDDEHRDRADRVAERLAVPVLIAALASVPAVFLTLLDDPWETIGSGLNMLSGAVLVAETAILLLLAEDRLAWVKRNWWLVALAVAIIPAIVFAVGPVQLLRLVRVVGALRILRVGRIVKAGRIVRERAGLHARWQKAIAAFVSILAAGFVGIVLVDDTSTTREYLEPVLDAVGTPGVVLAGLILAAATYIVLTNRGTDGDDAEDGDQAEDADDKDPSRAQSEGSSG